MFLLTYVGVATIDHVYANLNRFYMAVVMVAPMTILMLVFMRHMFPDKKRNAIILGVSSLIMVISFVAIRVQTFVGDEQFLKSMIPHHSIAIKTCEQADISDTEIKQLCEEIVATQEREINQMEAILTRIDN